MLVWHGPRTKLRETMGQQPPMKTIECDVKRPDRTADLKEPFKKCHSENQEEAVTLQSVVSNLERTTNDVETDKSPPSPQSTTSKTKFFSAAKTGDAMGVLKLLLDGKDLFCHSNQ